MLTVKVSTLDSELEFEVIPKTKVCEIFETVNKMLGIGETWYFGLMYYDDNNIKMWCDTSKKTVKELKTNITKLKYRVKYFPENVQDIIEDVTIKYFYLQVRLAILSDHVYCPSDTCVLLASYSVQVRHDDFNPRIHQDGFLAKETILPERVFEQHSLERSRWEYSIMRLWRRHNGILMEEAMLEYLKLAQNLEMYGITYFDIYNQNRTRAVLGISAHGLTVYINGDVLNPVISFPWSEISAVSFGDKKFTIKPIDAKTKNFIFFADEVIINKNILKLIMGGHMLYLRGQGPDPLNVQVMRSNAGTKRENKLQQRAKLLDEAKAREEAEKRGQMSDEKVKLLEDKLMNQNNLMEAQSTEDNLRVQFVEMLLSKESHEKEQKRLQDMQCSLEEDKDMEIKERLRLESEIEARQAQAPHIQMDIDRMEKEMEKLKIAIKETQVSVLQFKKEQAVLLKEEEKQKELQRLEEEQAASSELGEASDTFMYELKMLQEELEQTRDRSKETMLDKISRQNQQERRDKYSTLCDTRKGNMNHRVELFEKM